MFLLPLCFHFERRGVVLVSISFVLAGSGGVIPVGPQTICPTKVHFAAVNGDVHGRGGAGRGGGRRRDDCNGGGGEWCREPTSSLLVSAMITDLAGGGEFANALLLNAKL